MKRKLLFGGVLFCLVGLVCFASSPDAWEEFANKVESVCLKFGPDFVEKPQAVIDPLGTDSFGVGLVFGKSKNSDDVVFKFCLMNKQTEEAEVGATEMRVADLPFVKELAEQNEALRQELQTLKKKP